MKSDNDILSALREMVEEKPLNTRLPAIRELCRQYTVSAPTMGKMLRILKSEGLLEIRRGKRAVVRPTSPPPFESPSYRTDRAYNTIVERIREGIYSAGRELPKRVSIAEEFDISTGTVTKVLSLVRESGLIHYRSGRWIAGRKDRQPNAGERRTHPTIIVLSHSGTQWHDIMQAARTTSFVRTFVREAGAFEVRVIGAESFPESRYSFYQMTPETLKQTIANLEGAFLGCLLATDRPEALRPYLRILFETCRPVVWFDAHGRETPSYIEYPGWYHCRFEEMPGITKCIETLRGYNHSHVGYPICDSAEWIVDRAVKLKAAARTGKLPLQVHTSGPPHAILEKLQTGFYLPQLSEILSQKERLMMLLLREEVPGGLEEPGKAPAGVPELHWRIHEDMRLGIETMVNANFGAPEAQSGGLIKISPFLLDLLSDEGLTALICPNDFYAKSIYLWCHNAGYRVPEDLSIISFDNRPDRFPGLLSSVEFGFDHLGYMAFHTILGDIGRESRGGKIRPRAKVYDNGSLAVPCRGGV